MYCGLTAKATRNGWVRLTLTCGLG